MSQKVLPACLLLISLSGILCTCTGDKVTMNTLLREMTSRENLTYFPSKAYNLRQFSSYNRESVSPGKPGWFANNDMSHFLRVEKNSGRREFVLLDAEGPGAIVRWWMTFYKAQNGILRVYLDNDTTPVIRGTPAEVLRGSLIAGPPLAVAVQEGAPPGEEGRDYDHNFYVPLPFAEHCKITYECDSLILRYENEGIKVPQGYWWPDVFYNIGYRAYAKDVRVESLSKNALEKARPLLDEAGASLMMNKVSSASEKESGKIILPGDSLQVEFTEKGSAINSLTAVLKAANMPQALRSTVIKGDFDGFSTLWLPVGAFFGSGYSQKPHTTRMNQVETGGRMESFWVMPFRDRCTITLINYGSDTISVNLVAGLEAYRWKPGSMYFGASWHEYHNIMTRDENDSPFDLNFIDIRGKGVYAGDQITLFNNSYQWWGEGDEKIFVDGESFPSSFGTGSEDYYGYSFGRPEPFSHPFISQPEGTGNMTRGLTVDMRHRSLDAIPFDSSLSSNIELWHWAKVRMNYALTTYYYVVPPFSTDIKCDIEGVKRRVVLSWTDYTSGEK